MDANIILYKEIPLRLIDKHPIEIERPIDINEAFDFN